MGLGRGLQKGAPASAEPAGSPSCDPAQGLRVLHQLGLIGVLAVQPAEHAQHLAPEVARPASRMPVSVTAMSLLRTGIDQLLNKFRLASHAAPTPQCYELGPPRYRVRLLLLPGKLG
jgi:hypothetical protein